MLEELQANGGVAKVGEFMEKVKDKNSGVRLMGFGHRVYKNYDPRAKLMQETCKEVLSALGLENDPLFKLAMELERSEEHTSELQSLMRTSYAVFSLTKKKHYT